MCIRDRVRPDPRAGRAGRGPLTFGRQQPLLRAKAEKPRDVLRLEEQLADRLTAPVEIKLQPARGKYKAQAGEIVIGFGSMDELNGLLERLGAGEG